MNPRSSWIPLTVALLMGAASWWLVSLATGRREAWDSELYFVGALPVLALLPAAYASAFVGRRVRERTIR